MGNRVLQRTNEHQKQASGYVQSAPHGTRVAGTTMRTPEYSLSFIECPKECVPLFNALNDAKRQKELLWSQKDSMDRDEYQKQYSQISEYIKGEQARYMDATRGAEFKSLAMLFRKQGNDGKPDFWKGGPRQNEADEKSIFWYLFEKEGKYVLQWKRGQHPGGYKDAAVMFRYEREGIEKFIGVSNAPGRPGTYFISKRTPKVDAPNTQQGQQYTRSATQAAQENNYGKVGDDEDCPF